MTSWWAWALAAMALGLVEMLAPGQVALGFAIGAGLVALGLLSGVLPALLSLTGGYAAGVLLVLFAALSLGAWLALRHVFGTPGSGTRRFEDDVND